MSITVVVNGYPKIEKQPEFYALCTAAAMELSRGSRLGGFSILFRQGTGSQKEVIKASFAWCNREFAQAIIIVDAPPDIDKLKIWMRGIPYPLEVVFTLPDTVGRGKASQLAQKLCPHWQDVAWLAVGRKSLTEQALIDGLNAAHRYLYRS